ncbi:Transposon Ty3-G Gag-Pol polyprotein [Senna tora]|uniref:Transposon Ty3-G Gag-Pol polyprotein n=1 Tax=Senna tora TaxID=362788 RepID=A0A834SBR9_9FABA|nr:Transposon Ty3-G Gag-Pol polyprotein [Senna tora]
MEDEHVGYKLDDDNSESTVDAFSDGYFSFTELLHADDDTLASFSSLYSFPSTCSCGVMMPVWGSYSLSFQVCQAMKQGR